MAISDQFVDVLLKTIPCAGHRVDLVTPRRLQISGSDELIDYLSRKTPIGKLDQFAHMCLTELHDRQPDLSVGIK
jgi:hypothetical protein